MLGRPLVRDYADGRCGAVAVIAGSGAIACRYVCGTNRYRRQQLRLYVHKGQTNVVNCDRFCKFALGLVVIGAIFGIWLSCNPADLSAGAYVMQQQHGIRTLKVVMPLLGGTTTLLTIVAAGLAHNDQVRLVMLAVAAACFVAVGLITRLLNQPINAIVITWSADAPPSNWTEMRDRWWRGHVARTIIGLGGLCLLIAATLKRACP